jgi:hypothetical protein
VRFVVNEIIVVNICSTIEILLKLQKKAGAVVLSEKAKKEIWLYLPERDGI